MINRILIRIKVIQILYSFLLVEKQFTLEDAPASPTRESRFAYSLYMDMLLLMMRLSKMVERRANDYPLAQTRFMERLRLDDILAANAKRNSSLNPFSGIEASIASKIEQSAIYKKYLKDLGNHVAGAEEEVWRNLFSHVIITDPDLNKIISSRENYSLKALERMKEMMNRTFVNFLASQDNVEDVERALATSLDKTRELYYRLLWLPVELTDMQDRRLDDNRHKFLKTEEDINPNLRFVENSVVDALRHNQEVETYISKNKLSWLKDDPLMMHQLLKAVLESNIYQEYMAKESVSPREDASLWRDLLRNVILVNANFLESLEEKSVLWNDDVDIISEFVMKTFRRIADGEGPEAVFDKFKDEEDARFGSQLLRALYLHKEEYRSYIDHAVKDGSWEAERLAFMDVVILEAALAEILNFPGIPLRVSVNEYIELAKSYSTARSGQFVNGVLGAVIDRLKKEGKLLKP